AYVRTVFLLTSSLFRSTSILRTFTFTQFLVIISEEVPLSGLTIIFLDRPFSHSIDVAEDLLLDVSSPLLSNNVVCTDSTGSAYLVDLATEKKISDWKAHSLPYSDARCEVWTCASNGNLVCTGGEDATLKIWDVRDHSAIQQHSEFSAGVTFSGWEGDHVRLLTTGRYKLSVMILGFQTAGGVWHIENCERTYLVACMYGGWALFDKNLKLSLANKTAGEQLLYGVTMISDRSIVYTSFNDCKVTITTL
ncbi:unnamed protein product, partial [Angiostrongylus costaricensis]|uniref:methylated diphthine methylhydrolase n=1 Tax=Angiostrongylus costaricensis TaxID=334426 RepID=A0A0R3PH77_ANGCS